MHRCSASRLTAQTSLPVTYADFEAYGIERHGFCPDPEPAVDEHWDVVHLVADTALSMGPQVEVLAGIIFYWFALRVGPPPSAASAGEGPGAPLDPRVANVVALWLAIGPAYLMQFSIAPIGGEQMFVLSAIIFWFAVRTGLARDRHWFILGLLAGFGWWIHQGIAFALAAAVIAAILRSEWWRNVRAIPMRRPPLVAIILAALIAIDLILGAIVSLGYEAPAFFLFDPVMEPLIALLILIAVTVILVLMPVTVVVLNVEQLHARKVHEQTDDGDGERLAERDR